MVCLTDYDSPPKSSDDAVVQKEPYKCSGHLVQPRLQQQQLIGTGLKPVTLSANKLPNDHHMLNLWHELSPASKGMPEKVRQGCKLKVFLTGGFIRYSHFSYIFGLARSTQPPECDHFKAQSLSSPECLTDVSLRSDETTTKLIIDLWPRVLWYQVHSSCLSMVFIMDKPWLT